MDTEAPLGPFKRLTAVTLTLLAVFGLAARITGHRETAAIAAMKIMKPRGPRLRCGVSRASNSSRSSRRFPLSFVLRVRSAIGQR